MASCLMSVAFFSAQTLLVQKKIRLRRFLCTLFFLLLSVPIKKGRVSNKNSSFHCLYLPNHPWQMTLVAPYHTSQYLVLFSHTHSLLCRSHGMIDIPKQLSRGQSHQPHCGLPQQKWTCPNVQEGAFWPGWKNIRDRLTQKADGTVLNDRAGEVQSPSWHVQCWSWAVHGSVQIRVWMI